MDRYKVFIISLAVIAGLLFGSTAYFAYSFNAEQAKRNSILSSINEINKVIADFEVKYAEFDSEMKDSRDTISEKTIALAEKEAAIAELSAKLVALNEQINELSLHGDAGKYTESLLQTIDVISSKLASMQKEYDDLSSELDAWRSVLTVDIGAQTELVGKLMEYVTTGAPMRSVRNGDGKTTEQYPFISFAYTDLGSGYSISYNDTAVRYSASLIKLPYIYSILREISAFEDNKLKYAANGDPLYDNDGNALFDGSHPNYDKNGKIIYFGGEKKYDLDEVWTYDAKTMTVAGSGTIKTMKSGTKLTVRELIEFALLYSDNIAFDQLIKRFGYESFYSLVNRLGIKGTASGFMVLSAEDCDKILDEVYDFLRSDAKYGSMMNDLMKRSLCNYMIGGGVYGSEVAHKYGWDTDAFHDMAIVWDEHPYSLVVMTDLDYGREEDVAFIQNISQMINQIHRGFYSYFDRLTVHPGDNPADLPTTPAETDDVTADVTETVTADMTDEVTGTVTADVTADATADATETATADVTADATAEVTESATADATEEAASDTVTADATDG